MDFLDIYLVKCVDDPDHHREYFIDSLWEDEAAARQRVKELESMGLYYSVWVESDFVTLKNPKT